MTKMLARYAGTCTVCGLPFPVGTEIDYERETRTARHSQCVAFVTPADSWWVSVGQGYGGKPYRLGDVLINPLALHDATVPRYMFVLHALSEYYPHDGESLGVGSESGYLYSACVRAATEEESAEVRAIEARVVKRHQARRAATALALKIKTSGVFVSKGTPAPDGERFLDTQDSTGAGSFFVATSTGIWLLERHMRDGDDWNANNIEGCYHGWFLDQPEHVAELRRLVPLLMTP